MGKWRLIQKDQEFAAILCQRSNVDLKVARWPASPLRTAQRAAAGRLRPLPAQDKWRNLLLIENGGNRGDRRRARSPEARNAVRAGCLAASGLGW